MALEERPARVAKILLVELFSGIGGGRCAVKDLPFEIISDAASEIDSFALHVQKIQASRCVHLGDAAALREEAFIEIVKKALGLIDLIIIIGAVSRQSSPHREPWRYNLAGPDRGSFWHIVRSWEWASKAALQIPVKFLIEGEMMDSAAMDQISMALSCAPMRIQAGEICNTARDRLYWFNWEFMPEQGEFVDHRGRYSMVHLASPSTSQVWIEKGWEVHKDFPGKFPCFASYCRLKGNSWKLSSFPCPHSKKIALKIL